MKSEINIYRVRKAPFDIKSQKGAFFIFEAAVKTALRTKCNIYDSQGRCIWSYKNAKRGEKMKTKFLRWLKAAGIRALKTMAQTAAAAIGTSAIISEVNWLLVLSTCLLAGILSLLTSVAGLPEIKE